MTFVRLTILTLFAVVTFATRSASAQQCDYPASGCMAPPLAGTPPIYTCPAGAPICSGPATAISGQDPTSTGETAGTYGIEGTSLYNTGVFGWTVAGNNPIVHSPVHGSFGVQGYAESAGVGVYGNSTTGVGVYGVTGGGITNTNEEYGVYGSSGALDGVHGVSSAVGASGVAGVNTATSGVNTAGVAGYSSSTQGPGVSAISNASSNGIGLVANALASGGEGINATGGAIGVVAEGATYGVYSTSVADAVHGVSSSTGGSSGVAGVCTNAGNCNGVYGSSAATSSNALAAGVHGTNSSSGYGGYFYSASGVGAYGTSSGTDDLDAGIQGNGASIGVYATSTGLDGVYAISSNLNGNGVFGYASYTGGAGAPYGVFGQANGTGSYGVFSAGNLGYTGSLTHVSDERLKKNIKPLKGALDTLLLLRGVSFEWKDAFKHGGMAGTRRGFIAQEFEKVFPEWVTTGRDGFKTIDDSGVMAVAVEAVRSLKGQLDTANAKNDALEDRVRTLENGGHPVVGAMGNFGGVGTGNLALSLFTLVGAYALSRRKKAEATS